jgi:Zn-dependent metalloprotease
MKRILSLVLLISLGACENSKDSVTCDDTDFSYEIVKGKPDNNLISTAELDTVKDLFELNNLNFDNFLVYRFEKDDLGYIHVKCYQYINNLKVFSNDVIFHFDYKGHYCALSGELISNIDIKTSPSMHVCEVINLFLLNIECDNFKGYPIKEYIAGGFKCELGYYDLNAGVGYASQNFKRAWRISPNEQDYPYALINDSDYSLIYYDNGIRY